MAETKAKSKTRIPELKIVLDSNAIYNQSAHYILTKEIYELIKASTKYLDLKVTWYLPEIVRHERQYQMLNRAYDLLPSIKNLEILLGHNLNITEQILQKRVQDTIDRQVEDLSIKIISVDSTKVNWYGIMHDAAYRRPPFSSGEKEKGFRDALIAETFIQLVLTSPKTPSSCRIALVTGDHLLADAVKSRTSDSSNVRIIPTVEELKSLINILTSEVTEAFVQSIKEQAKEYFFQPGEESALLYKEEVLVKINEKFRQELTSLPPGADERQKVPPTLIGAPSFVKKEGQRVFWASRITEQAKAYKYVSSDPTLVGGNLGFGSSSVFPPSSPTTSRIIDLSSNINYSSLPSGVSGVSGISGVSGVSGLSGPSMPFNFVSTGPSIVFSSSGRTKTLVSSGEIVFEVIWSVAITTHRKNFTAPKIESINHIETKWE